MSAPVAPMPLGGEAGRGAEVGFALAVVAVVALLIVPLPPVALDLFLALSIGISLVVLLVAVNTTDPLEFSAFPMLLLLLTLFRLALNVSSTRLILGTGNAGQVIRSFGEVVIGSNYAVGLVLFMILVGINFIVITKGAGRVAEVAARFTLDAMPGKQMAIDADLSARVISESEAQERRGLIARQADFYGAMDGASKFVKGDAIAGLLITAINIVGGIFVGVGQRGLPLGRALSEYTVLTVGDGLVTQIPALVVSTAAGIMVTHSAGDARAGARLAAQLGAQPRALWITAGVLVALGLVPGLPTFPFLALGAGAAAVARAAAAHAARQARRAEADRAAAEPAAPAEPLADLLQVDPLELEVGYALIPLVDERQGGDLLQRIGLLRKQAALELGILVPHVRIRDDLRLGANEYVLKLRGTPVARAEVLPRWVLALDTGLATRPVDGVEAADAAFGMPARWVAPDRRAEAEDAGYVVVEPAAAIATHLLESLKAHAADLLGRQEVQGLVDALRQTHPALVDDVVPAKLSLGALHCVLQRLLRERVPIRDLVSILEALGDAADQTRDADALVEHVRRALGPAIARAFVDGSGTARGITIGPRLEASLMALLGAGTRPGGPPPIAADALAALLRELRALAAAHAADGVMPPLVTPPALRAGVRRLLEPVLPSLPVVSLGELPATARLESVGLWELDDVGTGDWGLGTGDAELRSRFDAHHAGAGESPVPSPQSRPTRHTTSHA